MNEFSTAILCSKCGLTGWVDVNKHSRTRGLCFACREEKKMSKSMVLFSQDEQTKIQGESRGEATQAEELLAAIRGLEVESQSDLELASEALVEAKGRWKRLEERKKSITAPIMGALSDLRGWFAPAQGVLLEAEKILKTKIADYHVRVAAQNQAAMNLAAVAVAAEDGTSAAEALATIDFPEPVRGISLRETWDFTVLSPDLLPPTFLMPNVPAIRAFMQLAVASGEEPICPGVKFFKKTSVAARSAS